MTQGSGLSLAQSRYYHLSMELLQTCRRHSQIQWILAVLQISWSLEDCRAINFTQTFVWGLAHRTGFKERQYPRRHGVILEGSRLYLPVGSLKVLYLQTPHFSTQSYWNTQQTWLSTAAHVSSCRWIRRRARSVKVFN